MEMVTNKPIDPAGIYRLLGTSRSGSVLFHYAVVKAHHAAERRTVAIDYEPAGDVKAELAVIAGDLVSRWNLEDALIVRRTGRVEVGEIISLVAVSAPGSEAAFSACRAGIEAMKKMSSIAKTELYG